jgi:asparagine synthase (glutamine-hydrolysing)
VRDKQLVLKGEELRKQFEGKYKFQTESDCEVILAYKEKDLIYR